jgi:LysR family transcriptional regulator, glycine cleavage system transcriptional activator
MAKTIPPLNPLRVFEAVARLGSFTKGADELHVSQSAVSRQISLLEDYLQVKLFNREQRGISLTEPGRLYQQEIGPAFARIAAATQDLLTHSRSGPVKVRAYTTFAAKWLMRRLPAFQNAHPEIDVRLSTDVTPADFSSDDLDLAIQFGDGSWPDVQCERLFDDLIAPVCSPALLDKPGAPLKTLDDLKQHRLLHSRYRKDDWPYWLAKVHRPDLAEHRDNMVFSSSILTYQAAVDGLGVAIGQIRLLDQELENGTLVCPFETVVRRGFAYYLLMPRRDSMPRKVAIFRDWLLEQTRRVQD